MRIRSTLLCLALTAAACSGDDGNDGANGRNAIVAQTPEAAGANCPYGGTRVTFGTDTNGDGTLGDDEVVYTDYDCETVASCDLVPFGKCAGVDLRNRLIVGFTSTTPTTNDLTDGIDLRNIDFSGADLRGATFFGVNLTNADFTGANLEGVLFGNALAVGADFTGANMRNFSTSSTAAFSDATLTNVDFTGSFFGGTVSFDNARAAGAKFDGALIVQSATIMASNANFAGASFVNAYAPDSTWRAPNANFSNANFTGAGMPAADWSGSTGAVFTGANFTGATFFGANLGVLALTDIAAMTGAFVDAATVLPGGFDAAARGAVVVAPAANLAGRDFSRAVLVLGVDFTNCVLTNANFTGRNLGTSTFQGATLSNANFAGTTLDGVLDSANMTGANFTDANLNGTTFTGATLNSANFTRANLTGVTLTGLSATGANFTHATIRNANVNVTGAASGTWLGAFRTTTTTLPADLPAGSNLVTVETGAALTSADLSGLWLTGETSIWTSTDNLSNVNFTGARITGCEFDGANLSNANFTNAVLTGSELTASNLTGANFTNAKLSNAVMNGANVTGANFTGAVGIFLDLGGVNATNANFTDASLACANMIVDQDTGAIGFVTTTGATMANTTCPDLTVAPAGSPADFCREHVILGGVSTPIFNIQPLFQCQLAFFRSDPDQLL